MSFQEDDINYILSHLNEPETLIASEFQEWLQEMEHQQLFEEVRNHREAFMRLRADCRLDIDWEYKQIEYNILPHKKTIWERWMTLAASVIIAFVVSVFFSHYRTEVGKSEQLAVFEGKKSAELILANGERINLDNNRIEVCESNGMRIINDSNYHLSYQKDISLTEQAKGQELVYNMLATPSGADYVVILADGTKVRLNCETQFRYPVEFAENERKVFLDGEAFFEVKKAQDWPFIVETGKMKIQVTGTSFNVKSYQSEDWAYTTLISGAVEVEVDQVSETPIQLFPSQQYRWNKRTYQSEIMDVDVNLYTDWIEGMFVFKNQRLEDIMATLSRWYSIEVFYTIPSIKELQLSANLGRYEHVDQILNILRATQKIEIVRKGRVVTVSRK